MTEYDVEQHATNVLVYMVGVAILAAIVNTILVIALGGAVGSIFSLVVNLVAGYMVITELFSEIDALITHRIRQREMNLAESLEE